MENVPAVPEKVKPDIQIVNGALQPATFEQLWRVARLMSATKMVPEDYQGKPEELMVAIMFGMDVGLSVTQAPQNIAVIGGRPVIWGDAAKALVDRHERLEDFVEGFEGEFKVNDDFNPDFKAVCQVKRKGRSAVVRTFSIADAKQAGLWMKKTKSGKNTPWITHPKRMLQMRARAFAMRDSFADALKGLSIYEEIADVHGALVDAGNGQLVFESNAASLPAPAKEAPAAPKKQDAPTTPDKLLFLKFIEARGLTVESSKEAPIVGIFGNFMAESCEGADRMVVCQNALDNWEEFYAIFNDYADGVLAQQALANAEEDSKQDTAPETTPETTQEDEVDTTTTLAPVQQAAPEPVVQPSQIVDYEPKKVESDAVSTKRGELYSKLPNGLKVNALAAYLKEVCRRNECDEEAVLDALLKDIKATATALLQYCTSSNIEAGYGYPEIGAIPTTPAKQVELPKAPVSAPPADVPQVSAFRKAWEMLSYDGFMNFFKIPDNQDKLAKDPEECKAAEKKYLEFMKQRGVSGLEFPFKPQQQTKMEFGNLKGSLRFKLAQLRKQYPAIVDPILSKFGNSGIPANEAKIKAIWELAQVEIAKIGGTK